MVLVIFLLGKERILGMLPPRPPWLDAHFLILSIYLVLFC